jgi:hypothetical protein
MAMNKDTVSEWGYEGQLPSCHWNTYLVKRYSLKLENLFDNMGKIIHILMAGELP